ncbi:MAG: ROK family protein [Pirellulales bacterium]
MSDTELITKSQAQPPFFVGVDLGGTNIKVGLVDELGRPLAKISVPTDVPRGPEDATKRMGKAVLDVIAQAGIAKGDVAHVGLGSPGTMDVPAGMLLEPPNLRGWDNFPIRDRVSHHCGLPVAFANDANAAAYGEFWVGSGRAFHSMVLLTLGTGVGGGIIIGDHSVDGEHSHGSECGHIIIDHHQDARLCNCGQTGHLEAYASATAVVKRAHELLDTRHESSVRRRLDAGEELSTLLLAEEAEAGDELSMELILEAAMYLGVGVTSLMHTIDPDGVVLGGAMTFGGHDSPVGRKFLDRVREEVARRTFPVLREKTIVDFASLGGDAGFIGAAGIGRLAFRKTS